MSVDYFIYFAEVDHYLDDVFIECNLNVEEAFHKVWYPKGQTKRGRLYYAVKMNMNKFIPETLH